MNIATYATILLDRLTESESKLDSHDQLALIIALRMKLAQSYEDEDELRDEVILLCKHTNITQFLTVFCHQILDRSITQLD